MRVMVSGFCDWLSATRLSLAFQTWAWFVPLVQTVHILGVSVAMTSTAMLDFRLMGLTRARRPIGATVSHFMPWIWSAFGLLLLTGILLTITEPARELLNDAFRLKMILVLALAAALRLVQTSIRRHADYLTTRRRAAGTLGALTLLLVIGIVTAGRWIAYV